MTKFTDSGGEVVTLALAHSDDQNIRLHGQVTDNGIGISEEEQRGLFKDFPKPMRPQHGACGTGWAPAISKSLTDLMNGSIWVDSELAAVARSISRSNLVWTSNNRRFQH